MSRNRKEYAHDWYERNKDAYYNLCECGSRKKSPKKQWWISVRMTDKDIIDRLQQEHREYLTLELWRIVELWPDMPL